MKSLTASFLFILTVHFAFSQEFTISGKVTDSEGQPIANAKVQIDASSASTITDIAGEFSLVASDGYQTLTFSKEGYASQEVFIGGRTNIIVNLTKASEATSDEVSMGFGSQSKKKLTGSVAQIGSGDVAASPLINLEQANQGKAAGMFVQNSSGKLGEGTQVRVRGGSTLTNSNQPLYVVDGVPLVSGNQSNINPSNIASIEILKDASAAAIYGSRAANGVIIITTKSGTSGKMKVDADYQFGVSTTPKYLDMMSGEEFDLLALENYVLRFSTRGAYYSREEWLDLYQNFNPDNPTIVTPDGNTITVGSNSPFFRYVGTENTDWQKEVFRTGISHRANVGVQGGNEKLGYFVSAGYNTQEGILIGNRFDRFNGSVSLDSKISQKLKANANFNYIYTKDWKLREDADLGSPLQAIALPSTDSPDPSNNYENIVSNRYSPLTEIRFSDNLGFNSSFIGSLGLTYDATKFLSFDLSGGVDFSDRRSEWRQGPQTQDGGSTGRTQLTESDIRNYNFNGWATITPEINSNHDLSFVLGTSYQKSGSEFDSRYADVNGISQLENLENGNELLTVEDIPSGLNVLVSAFSRANYSYKDKYIIQLSGRVDGSSKFGANNRYGFFPAASAGWVVSEEGFMSGLSAISFLKLKGSWGIIGNMPIDDFLGQRVFFQSNYAGNQTLRLANLANPNLKWETTAQTGLGVEFGLTEFISGSVEYYEKKTTDLLFPVPVSQTSGFNSILQNLGSMENEGLEVFLTSRNISRKNFSWTTDFNISFNRNKVTNLGGRNLIVGPSAFLENQPAGSFYLREYAGVYSLEDGVLTSELQDIDIYRGIPLYYLNREPTQEEIDDLYVYKLEQFGDRWLTDEWDRAERIVGGNPNPAYYGGLTNSFSFGNFDLSFLLQFVGNVDIYYETGEFIANSGYEVLNQLKGQTDRWYSPEDENAANPRHDWTEENTNPSTRWVEDGSYVRLKTLTLTYHLPQSVVGNWGIRYMDVYIGGSNLLTFSNYIGYDPDVNFVDPLDGVIGQNISRGIDNFTAPQPRMIITGIKIGL